MARRRGRGGPRTPANPAPASGPGAASARTDGLGVGGLAIDDLQHGDRQVVEGMGAPPAPGPGGGGGGMAPPGGAPGADVDLWGPTTHPDEPMTAGMPGGPGPSGMVLADDPDELLRALYEGYPHPDILALLESREF